MTDSVGLFVSANGRKLLWKREPTDMYSVDIVVPEGVSEIEVTQDFLLPTGASGFTSGASSTDHWCLLSWNQLVLFPKGPPAERIQLEPSIIFPEGGDYGTALRTVRREKDLATFSPVNLTTLIDSPVLLGRYFRTVELADSAPKYYFHIAADSAAALNLKPDVHQQLRNLVAELDKLFGSGPHSEYHLLPSLSDHVEHLGLEHHESTDIRYAEQTLTDPDLHNHFMWITSHEVVHSWNGKFRRPAG